VSDYNVSVLKPCVAAFAAALLLAGCQPEQKAASNAPAPEESQPAAEPSKSDKPTTAEGPEPGSAADFAEKKAKALEAITKDLRPAAKGSGDWKPVQQTPAEKIAAAAEAMIASAKGQIGESTSVVSIEGNPGSSIGRFYIQDASKFYIEYPKMTIGPKPYFEKQIVVGNGKVMATNGLASNGWYGEKGVVAFRNEASTVASWETEFPRLMFSALQGGKPITNLLSDARKQGLEISLEEHPIDRNNTKQTQYRILITRNKKDLGLKGVLEYEIVIDGQYRLPVTVRNFVQRPSHQPVKSLWTVKWSPPGQKIQPKQFDIPKKSNTAKV
jgi:hypothetical protein